MRLGSRRLVLDGRPGGGIGSSVKECRNDPMILR